MSKDIKYELILEQVNEIAKTMKHLFDVLGISPREAEHFAKNTPVVVASFVSEDEAISKKEELENDGSAEYSINKTSMTFRVIIYDEYETEMVKRTKIISALSSVLGVRLDEAKKLVEKTPLVAKEGMSLDEAENLKSKLLEQLNGVCFDIRTEQDL